MLRPLFAVLLLLGCVLPALAQTPEADPTPGPACDAVISRIVVDNHSIFDVTDPDRDEDFRWAYRFVNSLHVRTRESVIRRELLFEEGDCYDPRLLEDSERLLRALGFLADVSISAVRESEETMQVIVTTRDEWSTRASARLDLDEGFEIEGASIQESNVLGTGQHVELFFSDRDLSQSYGAGYSTRQMMGTRWDLRLAGGSSRAGTFFDQVLTYPFVGEGGRWAARQAFRRRDRLFDYIAAAVPDGLAPQAPTEVHLLLPQREKSMELSLVRRFGRRGSQSLLGGALSFQELSYPGGRDASILVLGEELADSAEATDALLDPVWSGLETLENVRAFALLGHRSVYWVERSRLDALQATQDVRLGAEIGLALGRSLPGLEIADDLFTTFTFFAGSTLFERGLITTDVRFDARRDFDAPVGTAEWEDIVGAVRVLSYWRTDRVSDHTLVLHVAAAGGWHNRTPFQLTLGGERGIRGYDDREFPGGRMLVGTLEDRIYLGWPYADVFDAGLTVFADVGAMWAGGLPYPYGLDSGFRAGAGLGLRVNFPAGGRTTYRLDVAAPIESGLGFGDLRIIFSIGEPLSLGTRLDRPQITRSRLSGVSGDVFNFPR